MAPVENPTAGAQCWKAPAATQPHCHWPRSLPASSAPCRAPVAPAQSTASWRMSAEVPPRVRIPGQRPPRPRPASVASQTAPEATSPYDEVLEENAASTASWMAPVESLPDLYNILEGACGCSAQRVRRPGGRLWPLAPRRRPSLSGVPDPPSTKALEESSPLGARHAGRPSERLDGPVRHLWKPRPSSPAS